MNRRPDIVAFDPSAATYVRRLHEQGLAGALRRLGVDPTVAIDAIQRAVTTYLPAA